jgi:CxxC motif-containing protein (DUF1111 family)
MARRIGRSQTRLWLGLLFVGAAPLLALPAAAQAPAPTVSTAAVDPGPRGGPPAAGGPLTGLDPHDVAFFNAAQLRFQEIDSVSGKLPGEPGTGLGPRFNLNSCSGCHAQLAAGGSSPAVNPQIAVASLDGARNHVPSFITANGPVREVRFVHNPDGTPDGGVHDLFVISGRSDAAGCHIAQPDFEREFRQGNAIFRIPTPTFGLGLVENIPDDSLQAATNKVASWQSALGVSGHFNRSGNDGTIARFGWKAQNKSLLMFAGEAYNVEQGVTNELFPNERETDANCLYNALPEDNTNLRIPVESASPASDYSSDIVNLTIFMRLSAPPTPAPSNASTLAGRAVFASIGCNACHIPRQTTATSIYTNQPSTIEPFSDFAVHSMGRGLADGVSQGNAGGDQFRTAPLWGLGQRLFLLHDGRSKDLVEAINAHASDGSEANAVIANFRLLPAKARQDLLNFLRSL